ncbi:2-dehydropantoate 2-reductase [Aspergillus bertholletiae]|uniref:2-dehydropantoate 2-reductase n=1 Tax=Aspergillus bertholletiae TaxID=1226010 RepID=A0A5N7BBU1_9EURO|nr:2-dehydropantoate 2-reductase [Aspergillus bertholletiae]
MKTSWLERKKCLSINTNGLDDVKTGFDVNVLNEKTWYSVPYWNQDGTAENCNDSTDKYTEGAGNEELLTQSAEEERIECLIVAVKAPVTVAAMASIKRRLTPDSTVLFLQNGMGTIDELNEKVFRDPRQRPHYMSGVISHGLARRKEPFQVSHTGVGTTILGSVLPADAVSPANEGDIDWAPSTKYLLRTLTLTPPLVAVAETPSSLRLYQLEKLAMNCVINPLTAIMNCKNGELLYNYSFTRIMRLLLAEISSVICALPELQGVPGIESRFSPERLRMMVTQLANKTAKNHSSMLQDVLSRNTTEIEYMNGYIVRRGEELGIKCVVNYMMKHLVLAKRLQTKQAESGAIPIDLLREPKM